MSWGTEGRKSLCLKVPRGTAWSAVLPLPAWPLPAGPDPDLHLEAVVCAPGAVLWPQAVFLVVVLASVPWAIGTEATPLIPASVSTLHDNGVWLGEMQPGATAAADGDWRGTSDLSICPRFSQRREMEHSQSVLSLPPPDPTFSSPRESPDGAAWGGAAVLADAKRTSDFFLNVLSRLA